VAKPSRYPHPLLDYAAIRAQIKTGDVIAFSGNDIPSTVVKLGTQSCYVHLAIVLSVNQISSFGDSVLIAESHIDTSLPSVGTDETILGVQHQWLSQRLASSPGLAWWAALETPLSDEGMLKMQTWLREIEQQRIPYDFVQAVGSAIDCWDSIGLTNCTNYDYLFCSELVARALQLAGVIDDSINASEQTPLDVMGFPCFQEPVLIKK
jgi:ASC-1-like (ASCH) protein